MSITPHVEKHFTAGENVRDIILGMVDGLTVPFALAAGLSGITTQTDIIVTAGFAEIAAGSISMGLGGYLAARSEVEHYATEQAREGLEIEQIPEVEAKEVRDIFQTYGINDEESAPVIESLKRRPKDWMRFMMRFELGLDPPKANRAMESGLTIASAYILGGLISLGAYIVVSDAQRALQISMVVTLISLAILGGIKGRFTGTPVIRSGLQTVFIGGIAAAAAFAIARIIS
ncbi:VIT1/CCC1 transporter family protein [Nitrospira defluvii]|nr:VIT1/CCC1 transporter family protein [Nitrospira defluvii]